MQRKVVIEEFKQRYLNQPYGDVWLKLRPLAYQVHPYQVGDDWQRDISHIENATMDDVRDFFFKYYVPNNAIMVVAGNVTMDQVKTLSEKWFGPIPRGQELNEYCQPNHHRNKRRFLEVKAKVPANAFYKAWHMPGRFHKDYYAIDLLSDILGRGQSSRLYQKLVKEKEIFTSISSFVMGTIDPGLLGDQWPRKRWITLKDAEAGSEKVIRAIDDDQGLTKENWKK